MAEDFQNIIAAFKRHGAELYRDEVWAVQGVSVVKHRALERLAAMIKIRWAPPQVIIADSDNVAILVTGSIGDHVEWSIGEARIVEMVDSGRKSAKGKPIYETAPGADPGNYQITPRQSAYPWAMAEKRGKDRVILKLAGIEAFSEDESDDFNNGAANEPSNPPPAAHQHDVRTPPIPSTAEERAAEIERLRLAVTPEAKYVAEAEAKMRTFTSVGALNDWWNSTPVADERRKILAAPGAPPEVGAMVERLKQSFKARRAEIKEARTK